MEVLIFTLITLIFLIILGFYNKYKYSLKRKKEILHSWGKTPNNEPTDEKLKYIKSYYESIKNEQYDIDDITWNDLDMDHIYLDINNTNSSLGEEKLYSILRKPCFNDDELAERQRLISYFADNVNDRIELQYKFDTIGKLRTISFYQYIDRLNNIKQEKNLKHYLMISAFLFSLILVFIKPLLGGFLTLLCIILNIVQYYSRKAAIESYLLTFAYIVKTLKISEKIVNLNLNIIEDYNQIIHKNLYYFNKLKKGNWILVSSGSLIDIFMDYFRMLFHVDLIKFNSMLHTVISRRAELNRITDTIGFLDSMIAVSSYRATLDYYCEPNLMKEDVPFIEVSSLYHPLVQNPITNSISEDQSVLITGSNASGKSTFIKTIAINAILSQTIFTSLSKKYKASYFKIFSSMALRDNIFNNESYYIVEIKSLKRIIDVLEDEIPTLCFVDEVLRGTNTLERIAASSRILKELSQKNALVFAATHDIELTYILEKDYSNYHFQEKVVDHNIYFDYKLYDGPSKSRNAIKLLDILGYDKDIIKNAENAINYFIENNEWNRA